MTAFLKKYIKRFGLKKIQLRNGTWFGVLHQSVMKHGKSWSNYFIRHTIRIKIIINATCVPHEVVWLCFLGQWSTHNQSWNVVVINLLNVVFLMNLALDIWNIPCMCRPIFYIHVYIFFHLKKTTTCFMHRNSESPVYTFYCCNCPVTFFL